MRFTLPALATLALACGSYASGPPGPRTAAERAASERAASEEAPVTEGKAWGGWRYQGARDDCFFVVYRRCFTTLAAACEEAECKAGCTTTGAGPATVLCK